MRLERELDRTSRDGKPLTVVIGDIDHFKDVNDTWGHLAGDRALVEVSRRLQRSVRTYDGVGRYGGEEFMLVLPGCGVEDGAVLAERLRASVASEPIQTEHGPISISMSFGVTTIEGASGVIGRDEIVRVTDEAMYAAKRAGRDRVMRGGLLQRADGRVHAARP